MKSSHNFATATEILVTRAGAHPGFSWGSNLGAPNLQESTGAGGMLPWANIDIWNVKDVTPGFSVYILDNARVNQKKGGSNESP